MNRLAQHDLFQHLAFWLVYLLVTAAGDLVYYPYFIGNLRTNLIMTLPMAGLVYLNLYVLIPFLLMRGKPLIYWLSVVLLLGITLAVVILLTYVLFLYFYHNLEQAEFFTSNEGVAVLAIQLCLLFFTTMALFFLKQWYLKERYTRELEEKNLRSELELLKHQIHPHFFFNTLNTVYMLMEKDTGNAKKALLQFSEILSHQLYDSSKDRVPLGKELEYLENYIEIQRLRHADLVELTFCLEPYSGQYLIAPMLLIVFVENAFKHSQSPHGYQVAIHSRVRGSTLLFTVWNSVDPGEHPEKRTRGGIGLANVRRRLELLYPGKSSLQLDQGKDFFEIRLELQLEAAAKKSNPMTNPKWTGMVESEQISFEYKEKPSIPASQK